MFSNIMIPIDLLHTGQMTKALAVAADLVKQYGAKAHIVGVTQSGPTDVAPTDKAFADRLAAFAADRSQMLGVHFEPHAEVSHDISIDLDTILANSAERLGADLIVMASHVPGWIEHIFASNAGYLASHASMSVFVVR